MKRKIKRLAALLLAALMLLFPLQPGIALAAEADSQGETVFLSSPEDLLTLAKQCSLDSWSRGKRVILTEDLDLEGIGFSPIPTFGGTFDGQGHTISGLTLTGEGNVQGLFRYLQPTGIVQDLTVEGYLEPAEDTAQLGGIAGCNQGTLMRCSFYGVVRGRECIGGIAGLNDAQGQIINCSFGGFVTGQHSVGGIAGENCGSIIQCENAGNINTTRVEATLDRETLNLEQLNSTENAPVCTDIGGIAGLSTGILQSCRNTGSVGYAQMGYNVGGIAGRFSGNLDGCENSGTIRGRKDVGGIAGQLEPDLRLIYSRDTLQKLLDELDVLSGLADQALSDMDEASDELSARLESLSDGADEAIDAAGDLMDSVTDWANGNIRRINRLISRIARLADDISPDLESLADLLDLAGSLGGRLEDIIAGAGLSPEEEALWQEALAQFDQAQEDVRACAVRLGQALAELRDSLGQEEETAAALEELRQAAAQAKEGLDGLAAAFGRILQLMRETGASLGDPVWELAGEIEDALSSLPGLMGEMAADAADFLDRLADQPSDTFRPVSSTMRHQGDALSDALDGLMEDADALRENLADSGDELGDDLQAINNQMSAINRLLQDAVAEAQEDDGLEDRFEDVSASAGADTSSCLSNSRNSGIVEGEYSTAGIAGSLALEYDFDPEDDLTKEGKRSLDFRYEASAAVLACVNTGEITGKLEHTGGIAGRMDLGLIDGCENYGTITSTDGSYTGGIAGASWGEIRDCWVQCILSGEKHTGGVAGLGSTLTGCHTLVEIEDGVSYLGAIAGEVEEDGTVSGNTFTSETLAALDGISYAGKAEPVDFAALCATPGAPEEFGRLELRFVADGLPVAEIPFQYGEGISSLPEIPEKAGYSAAWPQLDYSHLTASRTLQAIYTPLAGALGDGSVLPQVLAQGSFGSAARLRYQTETIPWPEGDTSGRTAKLYVLSVENPEEAAGPYTIHCRLTNPDARPALWVSGPDGWTRQEYQMDGSYLMFSSQTPDVTFCLAEEDFPLWGIAAAAALLVLAAGGAGWALLRRKKKKTAAPPAE